jgi:hypothetical protein
MATQKEQECVQWEREIIVLQTCWDVKTSDDEEHANATNATHEDVSWEETEKRSKSEEAEEEKRDPWSHVSSEWIRYVG